MQPNEIRAFPCSVEAPAICKVDALPDCTGKCSKYCIVIQPRFDFSILRTVWTPDFPGVTDLAFSVPERLSNQGLGIYSLIWEGQDTRCATYYTNINLLIDWCVVESNAYNLGSWPSKTYNSGSGAVVSSKMSILHFLLLLLTHLLLDRPFAKPSCSWFVLVDRCSNTSFWGHLDCGWCPVCSPCWYP